MWVIKKSFAFMELKWDAIKNSRGVSISTLVEMSL
jgi:hypothetical protein